MAFSVASLKALPVTEDSLGELTSTSNLLARATVIRKIVKASEINEKACSDKAKFLKNAIKWFYCQLVVLSLALICLSFWPKTWILFYWRLAHSWCTHQQSSPANIKIQRPGPKMPGKCSRHLPAADLERWRSSVNTYYWYSPMQTLPQKINLSIYVALLTRCPSCTCYR